MLDLDLVLYFWIVLIGVITSRALTLFKNQQGQRRVFVQLEIKDYLWIVFSFIIGILIFSSFKNQIDLTSDIIINISLAFGFWVWIRESTRSKRRFHQTLLNPYHDTYNNYKNGKSHSPRVSSGGRIGYLGR